MRGSSTDTSNSNGVGLVFDIPLAVVAVTVTDPQAAESSPVSSHDARRTARRSSLPREPQNDDDGEYL